MLQDIWLWMVESEAWQTVPIHFSLKRRGCQSSECVQIVTCPRHPKTKTQRQNCSDNELRMHLITLNIFLFIKPDWPVGIHNSHRGTVADSSGDTNRGTKLWGLPKWNPATLVFKSQTRCQYRCCLDTDSCTSGKCVLCLGTFETFLEPQFMFVYV